MSARARQWAGAWPTNSNGQRVYGVERSKPTDSHLTTPTLTLRRGTGRSPRPLDGSVPRATLGGEQTNERDIAGTSATETDAALVARVRAGDVAAFSGLVRRHMRNAFGIAYHVLQHREDAEDAVQQAFVAALARLDTFDATRPFGPWISRVVLNHARSARRARTRLVRGWVEPVETIEASPSAAPDRAAERGDFRARVRAALALLPERQRLAVQLVDIEGYSPADVAATLELSPVTIRWHLMAARRKLRRLLAPLVGPQPDPEHDATNVESSEQPHSPTSNAQGSPVRRRPDSER
jgi:RNA polymerase sigma-70 factor (ECF subfamily)